MKTCQSFLAARDGGNAVKLLQGGGHTGLWNFDRIIDNGVIAITIGGNLKSLKESVLAELDELPGMIPRENDFIPCELVERMAALTSRINREIAVYIDRKGHITDVSVGNSFTVSLPPVESRRDSKRLSGIRCIHTHPNGDGRLSSVDINALTNLRLDSMTAVGVESGIPGSIYTAYITGSREKADRDVEIRGPFKLGDREELNAIYEYIVEMDRSSSELFKITDQEPERAILVGLETGQGSIQGGRSEGQRLLDELEELALTTGAVVVHKVLQKRSSRDASYHIGRGKVEELGLLRQALDADLIIFDDELSGAQVRNIEEVTGARVIDRTMLILDIFAGRARSREGKLQVELAQLKYRLPRLGGAGIQLSRLGGGIGTRGPGEKKLEVDKRHIRRRIGYLEKELEEVGKRRGRNREGRKRNGLPTAALVGYTNAGKSTLLNKLCSSDVLVEDKLFATLDPATRSMQLPDGRGILLIDTVGFIRKLPHELVEAFKSTLEETVHADVLVHVIDASSDEAEEHIKAVNQLLISIGALNKPVILALNKSDLARGKEGIAVADKNGRIFEISAKTGAGLDLLKDELARLLPADEQKVSLIVPYSEGWVVPFIHENGRVDGMEYMQSHIKISAAVKRMFIDRLKVFLE